MFDFEFNWQNELNTGIVSIDNQHKQLFRIGRDMEQLLRMQCIGVTDKQLLDIVCELREYVAYHTYEEEVLMAEGGYSGIEFHIEQHKDLIRYVEEINCPKLREDPNMELKAIKDRLQDWIFSHILMEDRKMADEIKDKIAVVQI